MANLRSGKKKKQPEQPSTPPTADIFSLHVCVNICARTHMQIEFYKESGHVYVILAISTACRMVMPV